MNATAPRATAIGARLRSMYGRRLPRDVWVASLMGPTRSGSTNAKAPSEARTSPISVLESVNSSRSGGRYAATVVIDQARPKAPSPSDQMSLVGAARGAPSGSSGTSSRSAALRRVIREPEGRGELEQRRQLVGHVRIA